MSEKIRLLGMGAFILFICGVMMMMKDSGSSQLHDQISRLESQLRASNEAHIQQQQQQQHNSEHPKHQEPNQELHAAINAHHPPANQISVVEELLLEPNFADKMIVEMDLTERFEKLRNVKPCTIKYVRYEPSPLEKDWKQNAQARAHDVCQYWPRELGERFLNGTKYIRENRRAINDPSALDPEIFSRFIHSVKCPGFKEEREVMTWIEPLAGLLRNPLAICHNNDFEHLMSCAFVMVDNGILPEMRRKRFVFDLGGSFWMHDAAGDEQAGMHWLWNNFSKDNVKVERFIAWEAGLRDRDTVYPNMPLDLRVRLSYIPMPASIHVPNENVLEYIRKLATPDDTVIFKLDIDTPVVEMEFLRAVMAEPHLVTEMMMEHHVDVNPMQHYWGHGLPEKFEDSYRYFSQLRESGVRMHSWP